MIDVYVDIVVYEVVIHSIRAISTSECTHCGSSKVFVKSLRLLAYPRLNLRRIHILKSIDDFTWKRSLLLSVVG